MIHVSYSGSRQLLTSLSLTFNYIGTVSDGETSARVRFNKEYSDYFSDSCSILKRAIIKLKKTKNSFIYGSLIVVILGKG